MENTVGKIDVLKDTMLFITNTIFNENIKKNNNKEKILEVLNCCYINADPIDIIEMLPYDSYVLLEKIIKHVKENHIENEIISEYESQEESFWNGYKYLIDSLILVRRVEKYNIRYFIDNKVLDSLERIYTPENRKKAEEYKKIEFLILGMLDTYGTIEEKAYKRLINESLGKNIKGSLLEKLEFKRLSLNKNVTTQRIEWDNSEVENYKIKWDIDYFCDLSKEIISEQKSRGLDYKKYTFQEYVDKYYKRFTKADMEFIDYIRIYNDDEDMIIDFVNHNKSIFEIGDRKNISVCLEEAIEFFDIEIEKANEFLDHYIRWYNNVSQYFLCGYSPRELFTKYYNV